MNYDFKQTNFSRCLLAGLLAGLAAVVIDMILFFCLGSSDIGSNYSIVINPFTIFFGGIVPAVLGGLFYSFFIRMKGGIILHVIIFSALTFLLVKKGLQIHSMGDQNAEKLFHKILTSMIIIAGLFTTFIVPVIIRNKKLQRILF